MAQRMATAIGRSKAEPDLRRSAGARPTMMLSRGTTNPEALMADLTRDLASRTALSGMPTTVIPGIPCEVETSTSTSMASMPRSIAERRRKTSPAPDGLGPLIPSIGRLR